MKRVLTALLITACMALAGTAQELPQFSSSDYEGWIYNNPNIELSSTEIASSKIRLYIDSQGLVLTLISPSFSCQGIDTIKAVVTWSTRNIVELERTALTVAIDDELGTPMDSVTCTPTNPNTSTHTLEFSIPVPQGLDIARLRFVSWDADVRSCGAVKRVITSAVTSVPTTTVLGDLDGDGITTVNDVTLLISMILNGSGSADLAVADVDHDGGVSVADVTKLINKILTGNW